MMHVICSANWRKKNDDDEIPLDRIKINEDTLDLGELGITDLNPNSFDDELKLDFDEIL